MVARVGPTPIEQPVFQTALSRAGLGNLPLEGDRQKLAQIVLEHLIEEELFLLAAKKEGLAVSDQDVEKAYSRNARPYPWGAFRRTLHQEHLTSSLYQKLLRRHLLIDSYLHHMFARLPPISGPQVAAYVKKETLRLVPARVRVRHILVPTEEEAKLVSTELKSGRMAFAEAAHQYGKSPDSQHGGDLGWISKGQLPPVFDHCFSMKKMQISDGVMSEYGYHIFMVIEERAQRLETEQEARLRVRDILRRNQEAGAIAETLGKLKAKYKVTINEAAFSHAKTSVSLAKNG